MMQIEYHLSINNQSKLSPLVRRCDHNYRQSFSLADKYLSEVIKAEDFVLHFISLTTSSCEIIWNRLCKVMQFIKLFLHIISSN
jgi:hypothetical protein